VLGSALVTIGIGALTAGLVKGESWGWGSATTIGVLGASVAVLGLFVWHCLHSDNPIVEPALFRVRSFSGASVVAIFFSMAFGAMLLSIVLWDQDVWGWSALRTGLAVAPGPLMVPLFAFLLAGPLIKRFGGGPVIGVGATIFAAGSAWWALAVGTHPDYVGDMLGGMLLTGIGVGLTLPTFMATATSSLPSASFATGSGVVNMLRQVGLALGVAVLVAIIGNPGRVAPLAAFQRGWLVIAAFSLLAAVASLILRPKRAAAASLVAEPAS